MEGISNDKASGSKKKSNIHEVIAVSDLYVKTEHPYIMHWHKQTRVLGFLSQCRPSNSKALLVDGTLCGDVGLKLA